MTLSHAVFCGNGVSLRYSQCAMGGPNPMPDIIKRDLDFVYRNLSGDECAVAAAISAVIIFFCSSDTVHVHQQRLKIRQALPGGTGRYSSDRKRYGERITLQFFAARRF